MHCVAGDGIGILTGAVIGSRLHVSPPAHVALEYLLGFGFGWTIFQALFMRDMAGGSFRRALAQTFVPEFLSMNALMAGMVPVMFLLMLSIAGGDSPSHASFWFVMSIALLAGGIIAYPMNWWLVAHHLKHGMMTVRRSGEAMDREEKPQTEAGKMGDVHLAKPSTDAIIRMAILSIAMFGVGILASVLIVGHH
jgi:hypothetical protein